MGKLFKPIYKKKPPAPKLSWEETPRDWWLWWEGSVPNQLYCGGLMKNRTLAQAKNYSKVLIKAQSKNHLKSSNTKWKPFIEPVLRD